MDRLRSPARVGHLYVYEVDGLVVTTNVDREFLSSLPGGGLPFLRRLAREYGRPVPVEDVAS